MSALEEAVLADVNDTMARIREQLDQLVDAVNSTWLPPGVRGVVVERVDRSISLWDRLQEIVVGMVMFPGSPSRLTEHAETWNKGVAGPVSAISGNAERSQTTVHRYWEGDAVEAYLETLPPQKSAMERMKTTFSDPIAAASSSMAGAISSFWIAVLIALIIALAGIAAALIGVRAGGPVGIAIGASAASPFLVTCIAALVFAYQKLDEAARSQRDVLAEKLADNIGLPNGRWPRSTIE